MGRTKPVAHRSPSAPPHNQGSFANDFALQDGTPQTEYYPIVLNWTVQGIKQHRERRHRANLEKAFDIITARLAGHFVKKEDLAWAMRVGEQERERVEAEKQAEQEELKRKWAPRPMRKIKAGKRLPASELTFLDPNAEDSSSTLTEVSNVSDLRPGSRVSPAVPAVPEVRQVRQVILLENMFPSESASRSSHDYDGSAEASSSRSRQVDEGSAEDSASGSQSQDGEEEDNVEDGFDEDYWANELPLWGVPSADARAGQESEDEGEDGFEEDSD